MASLTSHPLCKLFLEVGFSVLEASFGFAQIYGLWEITHANYAVTNVEGVVSTSDRGAVFLHRLSAPILQGCSLEIWR